MMTFHHSQTLSKGRWLDVPDLSWDRQSCVDLLERNMVSCRPKVVQGQSCSSVSTQPRASTSGFRMLGRTTRKRQLWPNLTRRERWWGRG